MARKGEQLRHLTVGRLRQLLADRPPDELVLAHAGWDFPICDDADDYPQADEDGFILFLDYEDVATMVNKDWADRMREVVIPSEPMR